MKTKKHFGFLTRSQVMGRLRGREHDLYKIVSAPRLPPAKFMAIQKQIIEFFSDSLNKNQVFFQSLSSSKYDFIVYAVKIRKRISILVISDGVISDIVHLE